MSSIVFVHGLQGHPKRTWTWTAPKKAASPSKDLAEERPTHRHLFRRIFPKTKSNDKELSRSTEHGNDVSPKYDSYSAIQEVYWPRDLLATDFPTARVLIFGYNSKITQGYEAANKSNIFAHAKDFLYALEARRRAHPDRPLVFIAHSLGGILTKEVLRRSDIDPDERIKKVFWSTTGVFFMGTPHRGSKEWASFGEGVIRIVSALSGIDVNEQIVQALMPSNSELQICNESFVTQWLNRESSFVVRTFQESRGIIGIRWGGLNQLIVPPDSSSLVFPGERARTIDADHREMCRFSSRHDPGYVMVKEDIAELVLQAEQAVTGTDSKNYNDGGAQQPATTSNLGLQREPSPQPFDEEDVKDCLSSLWFMEMEYRRSEIENPYPDTSEWLFSDSRYLDWIEHRDPASHQGLLWIKGKPGAGKSTLIKEALQRASVQKGDNETLVAGFFFHRRGNIELQRTSFGLFRSICYQLLQIDRDLQQILVPKYLAKPKFDDQESVWTLAELRDLLRQALATSNKAVILFIDGLDECVETEIRDLVLYFRKATKVAYSRESRLSVCLASRHYPHITVDLCPEITVENRNYGDISQYVSAQLFPGEATETYSQIRQEIVQKADGIFLWAVLVTQILLEDFDSGLSGNSKSMQERLEKVPALLEGLFRDLVRDIKPDDLQATLFLVQLVLFAPVPLRTEEMSQALAFHTTRFRSLREWKESSAFTTNMKVFEKRVKFLSRGLVEVTENDTVQFIHQSVRDFFLGQQGLGVLHTDLEEGGIGKSQLSLIMVYLDFLRVEELVVLEDSKLLDFQQISRVGQGQLGTRNFPERLHFLWNSFSGCPLLWYIGKTLMDLFTLADKIGAVPEPALRLLLQNENRIWTRLKGCIRLLSGWGEPQPNSTVLLTFVRQQLLESVRILLSIGAEANETITDDGGFFLSTSSRGIVPLLAAAWGGNSDIIEALVAGGATVDARDISGRTILHILAENNNIKGVYQAIAFGIDINSSDKTKRTALHYSVLKGFVELSAILINMGADVNIADGDRRSPLCWAVMNGDGSHVSLLLGHQANADIQDLNGESILEIAYQRNALPIIKQLEDYGATRKSQKDSNESPEKDILSILEYIYFGVGIDAD